VSTPVLKLMPLQVLVRIGVTVVLLGLAALFASAQITTVGPNVQVSAEFPTHWFGESQLSTHPTDPKVLLACATLDKIYISHPWPDSMASTAFISTDSGRTWTRGPTIRYATDPTCQFGPTGIAYFGALGTSETPPPGLEKTGDHPWNVQNDHWYFVLYRSADRGLTWKPGKSLWSGDRPWLLVDRPSGERFDRVHLTYQSRVRPFDDGPAPDAINVAVSSDGGETWGTPHAYGVVTQTGPFGGPFGIVQLTDGTRVIMSMQGDQSGRVTDPEKERTTVRVTVIPPEENAKALTKSFKVADRTGSAFQAFFAVDAHSNLFRDRLYAVWAQSQSGHSRVMFTYSVDKGLTWLPPRVIDEMPVASQNKDNFIPNVAVNNRGVVGVTWYDRRDSEDNSGYTVRFRASVDGGETWLPSVRVSEQSERPCPEPTDISAYAATADLPRTPLRVMVKPWACGHAEDTTGLAADVLGGFHALWIDNHLGAKQLFTAAIYVNREPVRHGSNTLASLDDITQRIALQVTAAKYDKISRTIVLQVRLWNRSDQPLRGRLVARLIDFNSALGDVVVLNSDNGERGIGATFDFSPLLKGGDLAPKTSLAAKEFRFKLNQVSLRPRLDTNDMRSLLAAYLNLDLQILGEGGGDQQ